MGIIPPVPILHRGPCQPVWEPSLIPTVRRRIAGRTLQPWHRNVNLSAFVVVANKAQNAIDKEESEEISLTP